MRDNKDLKDGFENCANAVICIFPGQLLSNLPKPGDTVFHKNIGIDVVAFEMCNCPPKECMACPDMMEGHCDGVDPENCGTDDLPVLPNEGDDQEFIEIGMTLQHIECEKLGLENTWADVAERCTYRTTNNSAGAGVVHDCALNFGGSCLFHECKRI